MTTKFAKADYVEEPQGLESEICAALHDLADGEAPGGDDIPAELIKATGNDAVKAIPRLCRQIWETNEWPEDWRCSVFMPITKKGDATECDNCIDFSHKLDYSR